MDGERRVYPGGAGRSRKEEYCAGSRGTRVVYRASHPGPAGPSTRPVNGWPYYSSFVKYCREHIRPSP